VLDGDPALPKGTQPPNFRPVSIVAKWSPFSATAEHLFNFDLHSVIVVNRAAKLESQFISDYISNLLYCG